MWRLGPSWDDDDAIARRWRAADPFPHVILDDVVAPAAMSELLATLDDQAVLPYEGDLFAFEATAPGRVSADFERIRMAFAACFCAPLARMAGTTITRVEMRAYAYRVGHYLLPHSDHQADLGRALAFAYYLPSDQPPVGGELELFRCAAVDGELFDIAAATRIAPRGNRLVVFDVSEVSLHQVREVLGGLRMSLAGWFYP
jgi:Rps23 Pro-64 3,4-dihydroxylase Tpa1-like proline 4-hydroxylase